VAATHSHDRLPHGSRTPAGAWLALAVIVVAQAAAAALQLGLPAITPGLRSELDLSAGQLAALLAAGPGGLALSVFGWGVLADRVGPRRVLVAGMLMSAVALLLASRAESFVPFALLVLVAAVGASPAHAAGGKALVSRFPRHRHGLALGLRHTSIPVGGAVAASVLPHAVADGGIERVMLLLAAAFAVAALVVAALLGGHTPPATDDGAGDLRGTRGRSALRNRPLLLLGSGGALLVVVQIAIASYLVLYLHDERGWHTARAATLLAFCQLGGGAARIALGALSDRTGLRISLMQAMAVLAGALLAISAAPGMEDSAVPLVAAAAVAANAWNGVAYAAAADLAPPGGDGAALGLQTTMLAVAGFGAPLLAGWLVLTAGWQATFGLLALPAAGAAWVLDRARRAHAGQSGSPR
jgi:sugar phosphate permease